jgi:hypothetical protein
MTRSHLWSSLFFQRHFNACLFYLDTRLEQDILAFRLLFVTSHKHGPGRLAIWTLGQVEGSLVCIADFKEQL